MSTLIRIAATPLIAVAIAAVAFSTVFFKSGPAARVPQPTGTVPAVSLSQQRLFIYVGSSTCRACAAPSLPAAIGALAKELAISATAAGRTFVTVGVGVDTNVDAGLRHLSTMRNFDEVATGQGWWNLGVVKYVSGEFPGPEATPQVIVLDRDLDLSDKALGILQEVVRARKVGSNAIEEWARSKGKLDGTVANPSLNTTGK